MRHVFHGVTMGQEKQNNSCGAFYVRRPPDRNCDPAEKPFGDVIGFAGCFPARHWEPTISRSDSVLARHAWGRGIATEIGKAQLAFGFDRFGCARLLGLVDPRNGPSIHALTKLGLRYLQDVAEPRRANRSVYCIEAQEWRDRRAL